MKIRLAGFELALHRLLSFDDLYSEMVRHSSAGRFPFQGHERLLRVSRSGSQILGSLLTDRGHKNFLAIHTQTNALSRGSLGQNRNFGAFNCFVLSPPKGTALITCYRDAGGASFVFGVMEMLGNSCLNRARAAALAALPSTANKRHKDRAAQPYDGPSLEWSEIVSRQQYDSVLGKWQRIRAIEVACGQKSKASSFLPANDEVIDRASVRFNLKRGTIVKSAIECIKSLYKSSNISGGDVLKIDGVDEWGFPRRLEIKENIPSLFGELDHDNVIGDATTFSEDLSESYVIRELRRVIGDSKGIFG